MGACVYWGGGGGYLGLQRVWEVQDLYVRYQHIQSVITRKEFDILLTPEILAGL